VVNISASAPEIQSVSGRPVRFLKPSTATARRWLSPGATTAAASRGSVSPVVLAPPRRTTVSPSKASAVTTGTPMASARTQGRVRGAVGATASETSRALAGRWVRSRLRQWRMTRSQRGSRPVTWAQGVSGSSRSRFTAVDSGVSPTKGSRPVTISYITTPSA
jgi:hypothetical protein